jgi:hypothetical protein
MRRSFKSITMSRWTAPALAALLGSLLALPAFGQWKWLDDNGRTQYSDLPPPAGVPDKNILQRPNAPQRSVAAPASAASDAALLAPRGVDSELEAKRRRAEQEEAAKKKAEQKVQEDKVAAAKAENCARAKAQMRSLDSGVRIARTDENGEREILDDNARAAETKRAQSVIASDCR